MGDHESFTFTENIFGAIVQYPDQFGEIKDYRSFVEEAHKNEAAIAVAADLLSLALLAPPGEWGADVVVGSSQRFGIPMGFGGPHAGYFATTENYKRSIPGRIIGISVDAKGNRALRMALQTREQHIKRERATSNICTAQALLASMAGFYAAYHGPKGIKAIATDVNNLTKLFAGELLQYGYILQNKNYFDTVTFEIPANVEIESLKKIALDNEVNLRYNDNKRISISIDETTSLADIKLLLKIFARASGRSFIEISQPAKHDPITINSGTTGQDNSLSYTSGF